MKPLFVLFLALLVSIYKHGEVVLCPYTTKPFRVP